MFKHFVTVIRRNSPKPSSSLSNYKTISYPYTSQEEDQRRKPTFYNLSRVSKIAHVFKILI